MSFYYPNMTFDEYMQKKNVNAETRDEALSKSAIDISIKADLALAKLSSTELKLTEPHRKQDITTEWLNEVLGGEVPGAVLEETDIGDEHSGMADRTLINLKWNDIGEKAGLPNTIFVKATPNYENHREHIALTHMGDIEVNSYQQIQSEVPNIAPKAYFARSYLGGRYIVLLEDLNASGRRPYWMGYDCSIEHARAVITALAELHAKFWESERFTSDLSWVRPNTHQYGWPLRHFSFLESRHKFLNSELGRSLPERAIALIKTYNEHDNDVYRYQEKQPSTVLHGDTHLGNTYPNPDGSAGYFDWQCVLRGTGVRDVTNFILSSLTNEQRQEHEQELIDLYIERLGENGVEVDKQTTWLNYCLLALESLDRNMMTLTRGTYNHADKGLKRRLDCQIGSLLDHDVTDLLDCLVRKGTL